MARITGQKEQEKCGLHVDFMMQNKLDWGLVNDVVSLDSLESTTVDLCNEILERSPMA